MSMSYFGYRPEDFEVSNDDVSDRDDVLQKVLDCLYFGCQEKTSNDRKLIDEVPGLEYEWDQKGCSLFDEETELAQKKKIRRKLLSQYPYLTKLEGDLLVDLEYAKGSSDPKIRLPKLRIKNAEEKEKNSVEFLVALRAPWITFLVALVVTVVLVFTTMIQMYYPYLVAIATFLATVPPMLHKYNRFYKAVKQGVEASKDKVGPAIDKLDRDAQGWVVLARNGIEPVLRIVTQDERYVLLHQTGRLNVSCLKRALNGREEEIERSVAEARSRLEVNRCLPGIIRHRFDFYLHILFPLMIAKLGLQLLGVWVLGPKRLDGFYSGDDRWKPILLSVLSFVVAIGQLGFAFYWTRSDRMITYVNQKIDSLNKNLNQFLHRSVGPGFRAVLHDDMGRVHERILGVIVAMHEHDVDEPQSAKTSLQEASPSKEPTTKPSEDSPGKASSEESRESWSTIAWMGRLLSPNPPPPPTAQDPSPHTTTLPGNISPSTAEERMESGFVVAKPLGAISVKEQTNTALLQQVSLLKEPMPNKASNAAEEDGMETQLAESWLGQLDEFSVGMMGCSGSSDGIHPNAQAVASFPR